MFASQPQLTRTQMKFGEIERMPCAPRSAQWPDSPLQACNHSHLEGIPNHSVFSSYLEGAGIGPTAGQVNVGSGWLGQTTVPSRPNDILLTRKMNNISVWLEKISGEFSRWVIVVYEHLLDVV